MIPQTAETPKTNKWFAHLPPDSGSIIPLKGDKNQFSATGCTTFLGKALEICASHKLGLEESEQTIRDMVKLGRIATIDTAVWFSDSRERHFKKTIDWMGWAQKITDYENRFLYMLLSVGDMLRNLGEVFYNRHKETDIVRLEIAASITDERKQKAFLTRADFLTLSRDELRAEAAQLRGIAGREEHAAKSAKKPGVQLDFFGLLDGAAAQTFSPEELTSAAAQVEPLTLLKASQSVLALLDEAATLGRLANVSQTTRQGFAAALRTAAAKMDY